MSISGQPVDAFTQEKQRRYIAGELAVEDMVKETMAAFQAEQAAQQAEISHFLGCFKAFKPPNLPEQLTF